MATEQLVDYFTLVGFDPGRLWEEPSLPASPLESPFEGVVLARFPFEDDRHNPFPDTVPMFCFPHGILLQEDVGEPPEPQFHFFVMTSGHGTRVYGFALVFFEPILPPANMLDANDVDDAASVHSRSSSLSIGLLAPRSLCLLSRWPFVSSFKEYLHRLYYEVRKPGSLPLERFVANLMLEVPLPPPASSVHFFCGDQRIICARPPARYLPLLNVSLLPLFQSLDLGNVLILFTCVLTERKILLMSSDYGVLAVVGEAITSLMFPFYWQHVYIPVLPHQLVYFLEAPLPYIIGIHTYYAHECAVPREVVIVNLDNNTIDLPELVPSLPVREYNELVQALNKFHHLFDQANGSNSVAPVRKLEDTTPSDSISGHVDDETSSQGSASMFPCLESVRNSSFRVTPPMVFARNDGIVPVDTETHEIRRAFLHFFGTLFNEYYDFLIFPASGVTDHPLKVFDTEAFLCDQPEASRDFLGRFLETQAFISFVEDRVHGVHGNTSIPGSKDAKDTGLQFFDLCIEMENRKSNPVRMHSSSVAGSPLKHSSVQRESYTAPAPAPLTTTTDVVGIRRSLPFSELRKELIGDLMPRLADVFIPEEDGESHRKRSTPQAASLMRKASSIVSPYATVRELLTHELGEAIRKMIICSAPNDSGTLFFSEENSTQERSIVKQLCVSLERIWSHGYKVTKSGNRQNAAALWKFLDMASRDQTQSAPVSSITRIKKLTAVNTHVARGRAWVRLALERRALAEFLEFFLDELKNYMSLWYDDYAFLRNQESRGVMLTHLSGLSALRFQSFTGNYEESRDIPERRRFALPWRSPSGKGLREYMGGFVTKLRTRQSTTSSLAFVTPSDMSFSLMN